VGAGRRALEDLELSVLVTGGHGLLGSWLMTALLERGERVIALDLESPADASEISFIRGDLLEPGLVDGVLAEHAVQTVFHLAAQTLVGVARRAPIETFETNIRGTWLLLEACRRHGCERVIVASSDKAYGRQAELPYVESDPLLASYPYDVSKAACDMLARSYWHTYALPVAVTRFANVYGGGDTNQSRLIPEVISAALAGRPPVIRSDGSPERDFLYVEDAVRAYLAIWDLLGSGEGLGEAFNAGSGRPRRVADVVALICELAGATLTPEIRGAGTPAGEIDRQWVDAAKLRRLTGWEPQVTLEDGLARTIEWYRAHPASWQPD
jgi:CDP-glucose 4,6-dehydratase